MDGLQVQDPAASPATGSAKYSEFDSVPIKPDRPPLPLLREVAFVVTILAAQLLTQAGIGQGLAPLHIIGDHFNVKNPGKLSWYVASFSLTAGTFILVAGRLGDMYGHKRVFMAAFTWYGVWSILLRRKLLFQRHLLLRSPRLLGNGSGVFDTQRVGLAGDDVPQRNAKEHHFQPVRCLRAGGIHPRRHIFFPACAICNMGLGLLDHGDCLLHHGGRHDLVATVGLLVSESHDLGAVS